MEPEKAGELARSHWLIENHLHWNSAFAETLGSDSESQSRENQATNLLVADLRALPLSDKRNAIIEKARRGYYSDYCSSLPFPKMQLVLDLTDAGFTELASLAQNGRYDT